MKYEKRKIDTNGILKRFADIKTTLIEQGYGNSGIFQRICQQENLLKEQIPTLVASVKKLKIFFSFMAVILVSIITLSFIYASVLFLNNALGSQHPLDELQSIDSVVSIIIAGIVSVGSVMFWSNSQAHKKINDALTDLRAFIHIVDMHHLAKPRHIIGALENGSVEASEKQKGAYISAVRDSILISGKIAALIYQISSDNVSRHEATEIEQLCEAIAMRLLLRYPDYI